MNLLKFAVVLVSVLMACAPRPDFIPGQISSYVVDFTPYVKKGFLITPEAYRGDYDGVGYIEISYRPPIRKTKVEGPGVFGTMAEYEDITVEFNLGDALDAMYRQATDMGADAVMNFQMRSEKFLINMKFVDGLVLSGYAIKRKGAFN